MFGMARVTDMQLTQLCCNLCIMTTGVHQCCTLPQVYAVALYVEGETAAKELGIRYRGGFFETDDDYCSALVDGAFSKTLVVSKKGCLSSAMVGWSIGCGS